MSKIIAVHGATGTQGGSVVKALQKSDWKVRAITRNASGESAKSLVESGVEVVSGNFDDEASLIKAYEGVEAIFLVTNFWEHLFTGKSPDQSGELEAAQALTVIKIADKLPNLKHFIWSTLPGNAEGQAKRHVVPHFDYKAKVDVTIRKQYPNLAAKTTFLYIGYYANNLANFPHAKFVQVPASFGVYLWITPVSRKTVYPSAGDTSINVGIFTKAILAQSDKTAGKYVSCVVDFPTGDDIVQYFKEITGKPAAHLEVNSSDYDEAFGAAGAELGANLKAFEENSRWSFDNDPLTAKDLGIEKDLVSTKQCMASLKDQLL